jgi:hypothetical protein
MKSPERSLKLSKSNKGLLDQSSQVTQASTEGRSKISGFTKTSKGTNMTKEDLQRYFQEKKERIEEEARSRISIASQNRQLMIRRVKRQNSKTPVDDTRSLEIVKNLVPDEKTTNPGKSMQELEKLNPDDLII